MKESDKEIHHLTDLNPNWLSEVYRNSSHFIRSTDSNTLDVIVAIAIGL